MNSMCAELWKWIHLCNVWLKGETYIPAPGNSLTLASLLCPCLKHIQIESFLWYPSWKYFQFKERKCKNKFHGGIGVDNASMLACVWSHFWRLQCVDTGEVTVKSYCTVLWSHEHYSAFLIFLPLHLFERRIHVILYQSCQKNLTNMPTLTIEEERNEAIFKIQNAI